MMNPANIRSIATSTVHNTAKDTTSAAIAVSATATNSYKITSSLFVIL